MLLFHSLPMLTNSSWVQRSVAQEFAQPNFQKTGILVKLEIPLIPSFSIRHKLSRESRDANECNGSCILSSKKVHLQKPIQNRAFFAPVLIVLVESDLTEKKEAEAETGKHS